MFGNKKLKELLSKLENSLTAEYPTKIEFSGDTDLKQLSEYFNKLISDLSLYPHKD